MQVSAPEAAAPEPRKKVSWAELFFDLVFVFAVTEISALLHSDHSLAGVGRALVAFVPLYWAWVGTTVFSNHRRDESAADRLGMFAIALCGLFMALAVPGAYAARGVLFGAAYLAIRLLLGAEMFGRGWFYFNSFTIGVFATGPLLLIGGLLDGGGRIACWTAAAALDLAGPWLARRALNQRSNFEIEHLPERFGLLLIIALGESIVAIGAQAAADTLTPAVLAAVAAAFIFTAGLWWLYFVFAADAIRHALATAETKGNIIRPVLAYGHFIFISGIIAVAVGLAEAVAYPAHAHSWPVTALLFGGCIVYLAGFGFTRWIMFHTVARTRLTAAVLVLAAMPFAPHIPALATVTLLAAIMAVLNAVEYAVVRRSTVPPVPGTRAH
jgi:low temperature requirement protein LtrA